MEASSVRANAKGVVKSTLQRLSSALPSRASVQGPPPARLYGVYRAGNAHHVKRLLTQLGSQVIPALHALDAEHPELAPWTLSIGGGARMPLLQALMDAAPPGPEDYVVIADDDVTFAQRGVSPFLSLVVAGGFDLAQPAHAPGSQRTYRHLEVELLSTARHVGFVEVGPLVVLSPRARRVVLPFPPVARMGWGIDVGWSGEAMRTGLQLGVVDATPMLHHGNLWEAYAMEAEYRLLDQALAEIGVTSADQFFVTVPPMWRPWQQDPPWVVATDTASGIRAAKL